MVSLEIKKLEVELKKVESGRLDMELRIMEREAEIEKLREGIKIQEAREQELKQKIKQG